MSFALATGALAGASWVRESSARDVAPTFVPRALLEYDLPLGTPAELALLLENELLRLGACEARLELDLGKVLGAVTLGVARSLGHSSLVGFGSEALGFSWSHARELAAISKALTSLPLLRQAFLGGALPRCKVREVIRVATAETEAAWLVLAGKLGTRRLSEAVAAELAARKQAGAPPPPDPAHDPPGREDMERVRVRASAADALFFEHVARPMLRAVVGVQGPDHVLVEALAADALSELGPSDDAEPQGCVQGRSRRRPRVRHAVQAGPESPACERRRQKDEIAARRLLHRFARRLGGIPAVAWPDVRVLPDSPSRRTPAARWSPASSARPCGRRRARWDGSSTRAAAFGG